ncbi:Sensor protein FixL [Rubripirellula amarantea]|uniref:histidine kinase n=1 Tax=Rubripirellula amarantea TaxID=2527999 RepID=A0A5C5WKK5_9BACT|nr:ATP-binding protein [Rubripirellula amarantea]TWT50561.1 Sensor protein FixL [Rubripirellula amarantea]
MSDIELLKRRFERERAARKAAESLLEQKSLEVYQANLKLSELAEHTEAIVETAADGIVTYGQDGVIRSFNRSAARIFQRESGIGLNVRDLFQCSDTLCSVLFLADDFRESNANNEPLEFVGVRASGQAFPAEVSTSRVELNESLVYTSLIRDLSKRKELEVRLGQAQKMESVGQLAAGIAHEINTPIQFVGDNIKFLQGAFEDISDLLALYDQLVEAVDGNQPTQEVLSQVKQQCEIADLPFLQDEFPSAIAQSLEGIERVATIVRAMKEFSLPATQSKSAIDINRAIENTLAVAANQASEIATIQTELDPSLPPVLCLAGQMNQCFLNLLTNAVEAIADHCEPGAGRIKISTRADKDAVEIRVEDNGPGIPAEITNRIFDPFFTTKPVGKGTGQGLSFVYGVIVDMHDGTIHAQSPPNGGTTFVVSLPAHNYAETKGRAHANSAH